MFDSTVISEYLDETFDDICFLLRNPMVRATNRAWALQAFDLLMALAGTMVAKRKEDCLMARQMFVSKLARLEAQVGEGPFFNGADIALVDFQFAPVLVRQEVLDPLYGTDVLSSLPKISRWTQALVARPSVQATLSPAHATKPFDEIFLPSFYDTYLTTKRAGRLSLEPQV